MYTAISGGIGGSPDFLFKSLESKIQLNVSFFQVNNLQPTVWEQRAGHGANAFNEMVCWVWTYRSSKTAFSIRVNSVLVTFASAIAKWLETPERIYSSIISITWFHYRYRRHHWYYFNSDVYYFIEQKMTHFNLSICLYIKRKIYLMVWLIVFI